MRNEVDADEVGGTVHLILDRELNSYAMRNEIHADEVGGTVHPFLHNWGSRWRGG